MPDLLEWASEWLEDQRHQRLTRTVVYQRGSESVDLAATIGRTRFEQVDEFGVIHQIESRDFLVRAADLVLAGGQTLPKVGDRIREPTGDQTYIYEVMAPGAEPPWRYSDVYRRTLRIHTKHVAGEG